MPIIECWFNFNLNAGSIIVGEEKPLSNYINHIAETPVDEPFEKFRWSKG